MLTCSGIHCYQKTEAKSGTEKESQDCYLRFSHCLNMSFIGVFTHIPAGATSAHADTRIIPFISSSVAFLAIGPVLARQLFRVENEGVCMAGPSM